VLRIYPDNEKGTIKEESMNSSMFVHGYFKLPRGEVAKLRIKAGEPSRFGCRIPSYAVTSKRFRFVLLQLASKHSVQVLQPFKELREVSIFTSIHVEFVVRSEVKMPEGKC